MIGNPEDMMVEAVKRATRRANPALEKLLEVHLRLNANAGFELAYRDPKRFKDFVNRLFGEYSGRLLEMLIVDEIKRMLEIGEDLENLEKAVEILRMIV